MSRALRLQVDSSGMVLLLLFIQPHYVLQSCARLLKLTQHWIHFMLPFGLDGHLLGFPRWLSGKEYACQCRICRRCAFNPSVGKIPRRRKWQPTPVFLPRESHGQRSLVGCSPRGWSKSDITLWLSMHARPLIISVHSFRTLSLFARLDTSSISFWACPSPSLLASFSAPVSP